MRAMIPLCVVLSSVIPGTAAEPPTVDDLEWMAGRWLGTIGNATIEEVWLPPAGGTMVGVNRTVAGARAVGFEFLRIVENKDSLEYLASPGGRQPPTVFRLTESGLKRAVFANPQHDFPQSITYWRQGDTLHARIEGTENGEQRSAQWLWHKVNTD